MDTGTGKPDIACFQKEVLNYIYLFNSERYGGYQYAQWWRELSIPVSLPRPTGNTSINIDAVQSVAGGEFKLIIRLKRTNHTFRDRYEPGKSARFQKVDGQVTG